MAPPHWELRPPEADSRPDLNGGSEDGELGGLPPGLVGLQDLLDEPLDLPFWHAVAVAGLAQDVDALWQLVVDARLAHRGSHGDRSDQQWPAVTVSKIWPSRPGGLHDHGVTSGYNEKQTYHTL